MTLIRPLRADDEAQWRRLWAGYLDFYESAGLPEAVTAGTFKRLLSDPASRRSRPSGTAS